MKFSLKKSGLPFLMAMLFLFMAVPSYATDYDGEMIMLMSSMHTYSKQLNPNFCVISNGGYRLYDKDFEGWRFMDSVEGVLLEDVFYGEDCHYGKQTPALESEGMKQAMDYALWQGKAVFNLEYCSPEKENSYNGSVYYNAPNLELNQIVPFKNPNSTDVTSLNQVRNYMAIFNADEFEKQGSKDDYIEALCDTDYDLIFVDLFFGDEQLTPTDVERLKYRRNGTKRMVCSYISVGEAEDYRYYWNEDWDDDEPDWLDDANDDWKGNYKVKYWSQDWQNILYGNPDAYLDRILMAGFDGAYFDVVDACEYFD